MPHVRRSVVPMCAPSRRAQSGAGYQRRLRRGSGQAVAYSGAERGGRRTEARLTDAGFVKLAEIAPGHVREVHRLVFEVLTPEQLAALGDVARAITAATMAEAAEECREVSHC